MIALGYIRRSKKSDASTVSLLEQSRQVEEYCASKGFHLAEIVADDGVSGAKRERWERIYEAVHRHQAQAVVTYNQDRLARDGAGLLDNLRRLAREGVQVHEVGIGLMDMSKPVSKLTIAMRGAMDEFYRDIIREKTTDALRYKRVKGLQYSGVPPFGYVYRDGRMEPCPSEQRALEVIRAHVHLGIGARKMIRVLRASGYEGRNSVFLIHNLIKKVKDAGNKEEVSQAG